MRTHLLKLSFDSFLIPHFSLSLSLNRTNSNQMYLKFVSDGSVQKVGFSAVFMQEVDECLYTNHGCEHECFNTLGSYQCGCYAGYELQADGKSCEGKYQNIESKKPIIQE